jgi:hypothetical protein
VMFPPSVGLHRYPVEPVDARGIIRGHLPLEPDLAL